MWALKVVASGEIIGLFKTRETAEIFKECAAVSVKVVYTLG